MERLFLGLLVCVAAVSGQAAVISVGAGTAAVSGTNRADASITFDDRGLGTQFASAAVRWGDEVTTAVVPAGVTLGGETDRVFHRSDAQIGQNCLPGAGFFNACESSASARGNVVYTYSIAANPLLGTQMIPVELDYILAIARTGFGRQARASVNGFAGGRQFGAVLEGSANAGPSFFEGATSRAGTFSFLFNAALGFSTTVTLATSASANSPRGPGAFNGTAMAFADPILRVGAAFADAFDIVQSVITPGSLADVAEFDSLAPDPDPTVVSAPGGASLALLGLLALAGGFRSRARH